MENARRPNRGMNRWDFVRTMTGGVLTVRAMVGQQLQQDPRDSTIQTWPELPASLLTRIRTTMTSRFIDVSDAQRIEAMAEVNQPTFWAGYAAAEIKEVIPFVGVMIKNLATWLSSNGVRGLTASGYSDALIRLIRMSETLAEIRRTADRPAKAVLLIERVIFDLLLADQASLAQFVASRIVPDPQGRPQVGLGEGIDWGRWKQTSPKILLHHGILLAARDFPPLQAALASLLETFGQAVNPFNSIPVVTARLYQDLRLFEGALLDLGWAADLTTERDAPGVFHFRGVPYALDLQNRESYLLDDVPATIFPGTARPTETAGRLAGFHITGRMIAVLVRQQIRNEQEALKTFRSVRPGTVPEVPDRDGTMVQVPVFADIANRDFQGLTDEQGDALLWLQTVGHELSHAWYERSGRLYFQKAVDGQAITPWADFGVTQQEWLSFGILGQRNVISEAAAHLGEIAHAPKPYWALAWLATKMRENQTDAWSISANRDFKRLAIRLSTHPKIDAGTGASIRAIANTTGFLSFRQAMTIVTMLRVRGVEPEAIQRAAREDYEQNFGPLFKTLRGVQTAPAAPRPKTQKKVAAAA